MGSFMFLQGTRLSEGLATLRTYARFLARMGLFMPFEIADAIKGFITLRT